MSEGPAPRAWGELAAVLLTGGLHLLFEEVLQQKAMFIALACAGWGLYLGLRVRADRAVLARWGFTRTGLGAAFRAATPVAGAAAVAILALGLARGTLSFHWHLLAALALYPVWGLVQQFLLQALLAGNLVALGGAFRSRVLVTVTAATLFGLVHWPDPVLMAGTFALGLLFTPLWLRRQNLWPLGLYHGLLGALVYYEVLARDPLAEILG